MAISKISDLNYKSTKGRFTASLKYLEKKWNFKDVIKDQNFCDAMLFYASRAGNKDVVKFLIEEHNANPNVKRHVQVFNYPLSQCIWYCNRSKNCDFRETAIYLMDNGADITINDNEPLLSAFKAAIPLIAGIQNEYHAVLKEHDPVIVRLLKDGSVAKKVFELKQEQFYVVFPEVSDIFFL